jgi:hypothetical protein
MGAGVVGAVAILEASQLVAPYHRGVFDPTRVVVLTIAAALAVVWSVPFTTLAFRRMDEFQRAASKFAWYWGGSLGLLASLPIFAFIYLGGLHWLDPTRFHLGAGLGFAFWLGYVLAAGSTGLGFLVALGVWRITRR